ncbi:uncharacterized protein BROUX77_006488 [Berkeleyomyces rouxiae]|uniref:uncharacterized protein n=1 Tax=Berkeleyomyces rouxiae TaxID=2035830 RepID=UPI003B7D4296
MVKREGIPASSWEPSAAPEDPAPASDNVDTSEKLTTSDTATQVVLKPLAVIAAGGERATSAPAVPSRPSPKAVPKNTRIAASHKVSKRPKQQLLGRYSNPVSRPEQAVPLKDRWANQIVYRIWADDKWRRELGPGSQAFTTLAKAWRHVQQAELRKESWVVKLGNHLILKSNAARKETSGDAGGC